nr:TadE family protein [uncultured Sphingomonas sp.]
MKLFTALRRDHRGATIVELAFALPIFITMLWMVVQLGLVFRALSGIQNALGEGARAATIWPVPSITTVRARMNTAVFGIGPGTFNIPDPVEGQADGSDYLDLTVTYSQPTSLLILPGPTISVTRSKRVWMSESDT